MARNLIRMGAVCVVLSVWLCFSGFFFEDNKALRLGIVYLPQDTDYSGGALTLQELEDKSDFIVVGFVDADHRQLDKTIFGGNVAYGTTLSNLHVTRVYKGEVEQGELLCLEEDYYVTDNGDGQRTHLYWGMSAPAVPGRQYLYFLKRQTADSLEDDQGQYFAVLYEKGRYPWFGAREGSFPAEALTDEDLDLWQPASNYEERSREYRELLSAVVEKYMVN